MFSHLLDDVFRPQLAESNTLVAIVTVTGERVSAEVVQSMIARYCPLQTAWRWEAIPHNQYKEDSYLVNFPSRADLERMNGSELGVPKQQTVISIDIWKPDDVQPMAELTPTWVHVTGVPNSVRHFLGLWAVGTLIGKTMDVDLLALRRNNVARILVAIRNPNLFETREVKSDAFLLLKGYSFRFTREAADYVAEPDFVPFIWKRNEKDDDTNGLEDKDHEETHRSGPTKAADGDTHMPQANATGPGASTLGLVGAMAVLREIAVTPFNMNPPTPRGKELVEQVVSARNVTLGDGHKKKICC